MRTQSAGTQTPVMIRDIVVTAHSPVVAAYRSVPPTGEFGDSSLLGGYRAPEGEKTESVIKRLYAQIEGLTLSASKTHREDNCGGGDTIEIGKENNITRLITNEFFFYTKKPLSIQEFQQLQQKIADLAAKQPENLHLILASFAVITPKGEVMNVAAHVECGQPPKLNFIVKNNPSGIDPVYREETQPGQFVYRRNVSKAFSTISNLTVTVDAESRPFSFNNVFECKTAGGIPYLSCVDICLDHIVGVAKQNLLEMAAPYPAGTLCSHIVVSNYTELTSEHCLSSSVTHADPVRSHINCKKMAEIQSQTSSEQDMLKPQIFGTPARTIVTAPTELTQLTVLSKETAPNPFASAYDLLTNLWRKSRERFASQYYLFGDIMLLEDSFQMAMRKAENKSELFIRLSSKEMREEDKQKLEEKVKEEQKKLEDDLVTQFNQLFLEKLEKRVDADDAAFERMKYYLPTLEGNIAFCKFVKDKIDQLSPEEKLRNTKKIDGLLKKVDHLQHESEAAIISLRKSAFLQSLANLSGYIADTHANFDFATSDKNAIKAIHQYCKHLKTSLDLFTTEEKQKNPPLADLSKNTDDLIRKAELSLQLRQEINIINRKIKKVDVAAIKDDKDEIALEKLVKFCKKSRKQIENRFSAKEQIYNKQVSLLLLHIREIQSQAISALQELQATLKSIKKISDAIKYVDVDSLKKEKDGIEALQSLIKFCKKSIQSIDLYPSDEKVKRADSIAPLVEKLNILKGEAETAIKELKLISTTSSKKPQIALPTVKNKVLDHLASRIQSLASSFKQFKGDEVQLRMYIETCDKVMVKMQAFTPEEKQQYAEQFSSLSVEITALRDKASQTLLHLKEASPIAEKPIEKAVKAEQKEVPEHIIQKPK